MRSILIIADGMADEPIADLGGITPLEAANSSDLDRLANLGRCGSLTTIPNGLCPGSDVAILSILGYDTSTMKIGRGALEAVGMGIDLHPDDLAIRCNIVSMNNGCISDYSANQISDDKAKQIIDILNTELSDSNIRFYHGYSHQNLLIVKNGRNDFITTPPQDIIGKRINDYLPSLRTTASRDTTNELTNIILKANRLLREKLPHSENSDYGIWLWSGGTVPNMMTMRQKFGLNSGCVISGVNLVTGIGILAGLTPLSVDGATGRCDTNYTGKAMKAIEAIEQGYDFVLLHIEACDMASHMGNVDMKIKAIEDISKHIVNPLIEYSKHSDQPTSIALLPDHHTLCRARTHTSEMVPFTIWNPTISRDSVTTFNERSAKKGSYGIMHGNDFINTFLAKKDIFYQ